MRDANGNEVPEGTAVMDWGGRAVTVERFVKKDGEWCAVVWSGDELPDLVRVDELTLPGEKPRDTTPSHYRGDGIVDADRAVRACEAQPRKEHPSENAHFWWRNAGKYWWRMWSKGQALSDLDKAIDCLERCKASMGRDGVLGGR